MWYLYLSEPPLSHFDTDCLDTESCCASSSCDQPRCFLIAIIFSASFITLDTFLIINKLFPSDRRKYAITYLPAIINRTFFHSAYYLSNKKSIRIRSAFDVLSKTSPDGFIIRKIPIDNHQLPLKIRQLPVASSRFFRFSIFFFLILAFSDLFYYLLILYTKHKFLFCLDPMLPLFSLLYRNHPGSDVSHHPAYRR